MPKILLIEDDLPLLRMYQVAFKNSGHVFITATDGQEGLDKIRKEKPDLVLLDLVLPKKHGFEVLKEAKDDPATAKIPVICLSVLHQQEDIDKCMALGAVDYFVKSDMAPEVVVSKTLAKLQH
ncbi:MAG: response regulator [bacterium]|nr:response regulator [bacterium]